MGVLRPGEEWFAVTFRTQQEFPLKRHELDLMLSDADDTAKRAYQGMTLGADQPAQTQVAQTGAPAR
jgi:hypothetical protein